MKMMKSGSRLLIGSLLMAILYCLSGCDNTVSSIPDRDVYLKRSIINYSLGTIGNYLYITSPVLAEDRTGFGGLLVIHTLSDEYCAFDLACPHEANADVRIGVPSSMCICKCDSCGEEYDLSSGFGFPTKGISKESLREYTVSFDAYGYIYVKN
jgi:hypothetical protein